MLPAAGRHSCQESAGVGPAARRLRKAAGVMGDIWGPARLGKFVNLTRTVFNHAFKNALIDRPIVFGDGFKKPSRKTMLLHKHAQGTKFFEAHEIRAMLATAGTGLRAMILLGINCGFG